LDLCTHHPSPSARLLGKTVSRSRCSFGATTDNQCHTPAVAFRQPPHQRPEGVAEKREDDQETKLPACVAPVHQAGSAPAPLDDDIVEGAMKTLGQPRLQN
jgi:hypothetical protein